MTLDTEMSPSDERVLDQLQYRAHTYARDMGFWDHDVEVPVHLIHCIDSEKISLMHSELSEALDALRSGNIEQVGNELADCVLRIADYCEARHLRLSDHISKVTDPSRSREYLHGRRF